MSRGVPLPTVASVIVWLWSELKGVMLMPWV